MSDYNHLCYSVLYKHETLKGNREVFFDVNALSQNGEISLTGYRFSEDGNLFGYGLSESGSDWVKIKIRNVETGEDYSDELEHVKFSGIAWTHDNKGFFYSVRSHRCTNTIL